MNTRTFKIQNCLIPDSTPFKVLRNTARFEINNLELLLYTNENEITHFTKPTREYLIVSCPDNQWCVFDYPIASTGQYWFNKFQLSPDEFLFMPRHDSIVYYNHRTRLKTISPVPFNLLEAFSWESKLLKLNDSTALLSSGIDGFFILSLDKASGSIRMGTQKYLSGYKIRSLFKDKDNRLWIGTSMGLLKQIWPPPLIEKFNWLLTGDAARYHIRSRTFTFFSTTTTPALPFNTPKSVVYDAQGDVWIGGHSLASWNNQIETFLHNMYHRSAEHKMKLCIPSMKGFQVVNLNDIIYCEASRNYTNFHLTNRNLICASKPIHEFKTLLSDSGFDRIHKSYVVNLDHIYEYLRSEGGSVLLSGGIEVKVSRRKKELLMLRLKKTF